MSLSDLMTTFRPISPEPSTKSVYLYGFSDLNEHKPYTLKVWTDIEKLIEEVTIHLDFYKDDDNWVFYPFEENIRGLIDGGFEYMGYSDKYNQCFWVSRCILV